MTLRSRLLEFLRVPSEPAAPAGDEAVRVFRAAPNYFRYKLLLWALRTAGTIVGLLVGIGFLRMVPGWLGGRVSLGPIALTEDLLVTVLTVLEGGAILAFVAQSLASLALLRLDFEQRWYIVSDRSLRIREGLVRMHEKTMTFANIQQVTIHQGPLQRLLGIADLQVRTAGGGGNSQEDGHQPKDDLHVAFFRGVASAAHIRDAIRERLRRHADSGLGDPDDPASAPQPAAEAGAGLIDAVRAFAVEARALREYASSVAHR